MSRLGRPLPETADGFAALHNQLDDIAGGAQRELDEKNPQRHTAYAKAGEVRSTYQAKVNELEALRAARTLIPQKLVQRREIIAEGAGVPIDDLPYAAELIDVADSEERWRPAAEKVLRNLGLRLLVPERAQDTVKRFIDEHDMRGLVEYSVVPTASAVPNRPAPNTLAAKLTVNTDHPAGQWLAAHLAAKFDHVCVDTAQDLESHRLAVTVHGTVKMPGNHYRKDDRPELTNPSTYILGGNIAAKRAAIEVDVAQLEKEVHQTAQKADQLDRSINALNSTVEAARKLSAYTDWAGIDHEAATETVHDLEKRIEELKTNNVDLRTLKDRRDAAEQAWNKLVDRCAELKGKLSGYSKRQGLLVETLEREQVKPHTVDDHEDVTYLDSVLAAVEIPATTDSMPQLRSAFSKELKRLQDSAEAERTLAHSKIKTAISRFIEEWADSAPDTSGDVERSGGDFAQLHADIVERKLPDAMGRFERMISDDMVPSISMLHRTIENSANEIETRIDMVNAGLQRVEFDTSTHLQIVRKANRTAEAKEFRGKVDALLSDAAAARRDPNLLMQQFRRVRELMARFTSTDAEARRWRNNVLDVRNAYTFYGREVDAQGETAKTYRNTASNSGGEQEKLVAFCLAAALSYNLSDRDSDGRPAFAPLMLDEAFSKSDEKYAQQALAAFDEFGFQLIMAAPIRMSGIVEPFIGQVVLVDKRVTATDARSTAQTATFGELLTRSADDHYDDTRASA
ncbi:SbcC/MukB-like Walker B domain-containing protein [Saccharopolyspora shandongensis]|uniref:ATP-binding protein n=1 Tax=Saccharopolyspora shandongensis TaxID=418495 RepID=UPI0033DA5654